MTTFHTQGLPSSFPVLERTTLKVSKVSLENPEMVVSHAIIIIIIIIIIPEQIHKNQLRGCCCIPWPFLNVKCISKIQRHTDISLISEGK
jgi:hypothetical protein